MRHNQICIFIVFFLFIGFISQASATDTFTFDTFAGEVTMANPMVAFRTYNLGQPYVTGTANFTVQLEGGIARFGLISSDGGHVWQNPGGGNFNGPVTFSVNPGQPVSSFQVSAGGTPALDSGIVYSFSGTFQGDTVGPVNPEILTLAANPQAIEPGKTSVMLSAIANVACVVDFSIQKENGTVVAQGSVQTTPRSPTQQADFVWDGMINGSPAPAGNYVGKAIAQGQVTPGKEALFTVLPTGETFNPDGRDSGVGESVSPNDTPGQNISPNSMQCPKQPPTKSTLPGTGGTGSGGYWSREIDSAIENWRYVAPIVHIPVPYAFEPPIPPSPPDPGPPEYHFFWAGGTSKGISVGDPVNIYSGNFNWPETDMSLKGRVPLVLNRVYNSLDKNTGPFGRGWNSILTTRLEITATQAVFVNFDGARYRFTSSNGVYLPPQGVELALAPVPGTGYLSLTHNKSDEWIFDSTGKIIRWAKACCGRGLSDGVTFEYDQANRLTKMENPAGNRFLFSYDQNSHVASVTDSTGRTVGHEYDQAGNQSAFVDVLGRRTEYHYDSDGFLTSVIQPGNRVTEIAYNNHKAVSVRSPSGERTTFTWLDNPREVHFTDVGGAEYIYRFDTAGNFIGQTNTESGRTISLAVASASITNFTDSQGNGYRYRYDNNNLMISKIDPLGNETKYEWDLNVRKVSKEVDPLGRVKQYTWCPRGNLLAFTDPAGGVTRYTYDGFNNRTSVTDTLGRTTRYVYEPSGNFLKQVIDPLGGVASYTYDQRGNLLSFSDQLGRATTSEYDAANRTTKIAYPDGRFLCYEYDLVGNVATSRDRLNRVTRFTHDANGRLTATVRPDGSRHEREYDSAGRLISEHDSVGRMNRYEYDGSGRKTKMIYGDGANVSYGYDQENRLVTVTDELGNIATMEYDAAGRSTAMRDQVGNRWEAAFDSVGRNTSKKDPLNRITRYQFDPLDRITKIIRPDGSFVTNSFDAVGNLLSTVNALGNTWSWQYDNLNRQFQAIQPNGASSTTTFDAVGQVIAETDANGRVTQYAFDLGGRRTATTDALNNIWRNFYDNAGRLIAVQDPLGAVSSMTYDIMDRVISQSDPLGNVTSFEFDDAGRRVAKTDAMGRRSITVFDLRDRVITEVDPEGHTVSYGYNLAGQRVSLTDGANRVWRWDFDNLGRVTAEFDPLGNVNRYGFDSVGNRISSTNARNQTTTYTFNSMNRLSQISYPDATLATMSYDLEGREISRSGVSGTVTKTWDSVGNMTSETFGPWGKKWQYSFDLVGNRVQAIDPEGQIFKYAVDKLNRVVELDPPDRGDEIKFSFDGAGRPVTEERPGVKTTNIFDQAGRLLEMKHERDQGKVRLIASRKYTYSAVGNRLTAQDENNSVTRYFYNGSDWLTRAVYPDGQQVSYYYNAAGDRVSETTETPTVKKVGRNTVLGTDTVVIPLAYDAGGRLISRASDTFVFDSDGNQATAVENGDETRYFWSPDNRLTKVERDIECPKHGRKKCRLCPKTLTLSESYTYEPESWRRFTRKTNNDVVVSVYDGADESGEYLVKETGHGHGWKCNKHKSCKCPAPKPEKKLELVRQFIGGPGTDDIEATKFHGRYLWHAKDSLGSTIALTNRGGHAVAKIGYDVFGNLKFPDKPGYGVKPCKDEEFDGLLDRLDGGRSFGFDHDPHHFGRHFGPAITPLLFTGRRLDSFTGQYFNRHRYYQPKYGRFSSRDPIGFARDFNLYRYANNNPVLHTDPTGKGIIIPVAIGVAVVGLWTTACSNSAIQNANSLYTQAKYPCDYDKRKHFYTSCYFNRCMLNLWPQFTFLGGLLWEVAGGDRNIDDVKANCQGIIAAYTFGKDCQDLVIGNFGP